MMPARKTSAILASAVAVACGALFLTPARSATTGPTGDTASAGGLTATARASSSHIPLGTHDTHVAVTLEASPPSRARPPIHVAIVLDRSGSMSGGKLEHATHAARALVAQLRPEDRFSLISYGSDVFVDLPSTRASAAGQRAAGRALARMCADGGTNLSGGLTAARQQLAGPGAAGEIRRVVLISDGQANEGIVDPAGLADLAADIATRGISLTTVGVGLDFDERVMARMAVAGRGHYYFAESAGALARMFAEEMHKLGAIAATGVSLAVAPAPGVEVVEVYGHSVTRSGDRLLVPVADLHAGDIRQVVLGLRVTAPAPGDVDLLDVDVRFRPPGAATEQDLRLAARAAATADHALVLAGRDGHTARAVERVRTARVLERATRRYEAGDTDQALRLLEQRRRQAAAVAAELGDQELGREIGRIADSARRGFAIAPEKPASGAGKRVRKINLKQAYDLMYAAPSP